MRADMMHARLKELYERRDTKSDSFSIELQLEGVVGEILESMVQPLYVKNQPKLFDYGFDWGLELGSGQSAYFEITVGNLSLFRIERIAELAESLTTSFPSNWFYLVVIGRGIEEREGKVVRTVQGQLVEKKARFLFLDYLTLIRLHENTLLLDSERSQREDFDRYKREYLKFLFRDPTGPDSWSSLAYLRDTVSQSQRRLGAPTGVSPRIRQEQQALYIMEDRLDRIELKLNEIIDQIKLLKKTQ